MERERKLNNFNQKLINNALKLDRKILNFTMLTENRQRCIVRAIKNTWEFNLTREMRKNVIVFEIFQQKMLWVPMGEILQRTNNSQMNMLRLVHYLCYVKKLHFNQPFQDFYILFM